MSHKAIIAIAPMMDWTDRHCRYFLRLLSKRVLLYTEMITAQAILHGDRNYLLEYSPQEHPLALQLGGSDPRQLAECAKIAEDFGYDEVNLNVGCPSGRVQSGEFGLCLMHKPQLVAECIAAMKAVVTIPVTIKTRIGVDANDSYDYLCRFIETVSAAKADYFWLHARKGWLKGLSPKQNREVPPLQYDRVYQLKKDYPHLSIGINGGIHTLLEMDAHLQQVDGVMLGRAAYHDSFIIGQVDQQFYGASRLSKTRKEIIAAFLPYLEKEVAKGVKLKSMTRHLLGLVHGEPNARAWRQAVSGNLDSVEALWQVSERYLN